MELEVVLFILRLISGGVLFALLFGLAYFLWRDYRATAQQMSVNRRTFGYLKQMTESNEENAVAPVRYPILPITSLGRSPTNTIVIDEPFASGEHAVILLKDSQLWLEDRNSRNGTRLNQRMIEEPVIVTAGDVISIGNIHFEIELS